MVDLEYCFFENLHIAKQMVDSGYGDAFLKDCGSAAIDGLESYELAWIGLASVFPDLSQYYNDDIEAETLVFCDPLIDEACQLCKLHEIQERLPVGESPLRETLLNAVYGSFELSGYYYDYDMRFYCKGHGRGRLVILTGMEFCGFNELPGALADVKNALEAWVSRTREKLRPIVITPLEKGTARKAELKEAA